MSPRPTLAYQRGRTAAASAAGMKIAGALSVAAPAPENSCPRLARTPVSIIVRFSDLTAAFLEPFEKATPREAGPPFRRAGPQGPASGGMCERGWKTFPEKPARRPDFSPGRAGGALERH